MSENRIKKGRLSRPERRKLKELKAAAKEQVLADFFLWKAQQRDSVDLSAGRMRVGGSAA